jgi:hypothetical protein
MDVSQFGLFDLFGARPRWSDGAPVRACDAGDARPADAPTPPVAPAPQHGTVVILSSKRPRVACRRLEVGGT